ncbi:AraC family transcriptional regulator [Pseudoclavibacter helvolus]|uniref:AraC family transcriptional regulator n=1 Tax=Pseudoclavibacter helvolus TaxID=255205 RepID=UPI003C78E88B
MPGSSKQDLSAWIARTSHSGEPFAYFAADELAPGAFEQFHGESGLAEFLGVSKPASGASAADFHAYTLKASVGSVQLCGTLRTSSGADREGEDFSRDSREKLIAIGVLRGSLRFRTGRQAGVLGPGDILVVNSTHALVTTAIGVVETLAMAVPIEDTANDARFAAADWPLRLPETALSTAFLAFIGRYLVEATTTARDGQRTAVIAEPVLYDLLRAALLQVAPPMLSPVQQSQQLKAAVHDLIEKYHVLQGFDADSIARALHISRRKLYRDLADEGDGVAGLIAARRVRSAAALLIEQPLMPLSEVSAVAGFGDGTTMRRHFLSRLGVTPADYRKERV